jgi:flagellar M-ring protein FliF
MLRSQQLSTSSSQSSNGGDIAGTDSNQGAGIISGVSGNNSSEQSQSIISEYELNQVNKDIVKALGNLDPNRSSITVSLLYGNKFTESPISTDEAKETIIKMVNTATGINQDNITITAFKMAAAEEVSGASAASILLLLENCAPYIAAVIIIIIVMIFVMRIKASFSVDADYAGGVAVGGNIDYSVGGEEGIKELDNNSEIKKQINSFIDKQPDIAAGMLRNWIYENDK